MNRKAFLIALLGLPVLFSDYKKRQVWPVKKVNGHRLRRGKNPPEPWKSKEVKERVFINDINEEAIRDFDTDRDHRKPRKWQKDYNPRPLQYWGTEPIEDTDLLGLG